MNERIRELAEQAGISSNLDTDYYEKDMNKWVDYFSEKFAELIIQECIGVADHSNVTGKSIIGQRIKEHFEIERPKKVVYPNLLPRKFPEDEE